MKPIIGDVVLVKFQPHFANSHWMKILEVYEDGSFRAERVPSNGHIYVFRLENIVKAAVQ